MDPLSPERDLWRITSACDNTSGPHYKNHQDKEDVVEYVGDLSMDKENRIMFQNSQTDKSSSFKLDSKLLNQQNSYSKRCPLSPRNTELSIHSMPGEAVPQQGSCSSHSLPEDRILESPLGPGSQETTNTKETAIDKRRSPESMPVKTPQELGVELTILKHESSNLIWAFGPEENSDVALDCQNHLSDSYLENMRSDCKFLEYSQIWNNPLFDADGLTVDEIYRPMQNWELEVEKSRQHHITVQPKNGENTPNIYSDRQEEEWSSAHGPIEFGQRKAPGMWISLDISEEDAPKSKIPQIPEDTVVGKAEVRTSPFQKVKRRRKKSSIGSVQMPNTKPGQSSSVQSLPYESPQQRKRRSMNAVPSGYNRGQTPEIYSQNLEDNTYLSPSNADSRHTREDSERVPLTPKSDHKSPYKGRLGRAQQRLRHSFSSCMNTSQELPNGLRRSAMIQPCVDFSTSVRPNISIRNIPNPQMVDASAFLPANLCLQPSIPRRHSMHQLHMDYPPGFEPQIPEIPVLPPRHCPRPLASHGFFSFQVSL